MHLRTWRDRLRALFGRDRVVDEIADELGHHRDRLAERFERDGLSPDEARRAAAQQLGNATALRDAGYDVRGGGLIEALGTTFGTRSACCAAARRSP